MQRETGGSRHLPAVSNLIRWTLLTLGLSAFCCVRAGQEGDVPESRRHRLAVQVENRSQLRACDGFFRGWAGGCDTKHRFLVLHDHPGTRPIVALQTRVPLPRKSDRKPNSLVRAPGFGTLLGVNARCFSNRKLCFKLRPCRRTRSRDFYACLSYAKPG